MARDARFPFERFGMPRTKRVREAQLFPLFLKLRNRPCLVVGAGRVGESKIAGLLAAGAKVRVVAPQATPKVESWARSRKLRWLQREFRAEDLRGILLVVAATSSRDLHREIFRLAQKEGALCNVVDDPPLCDFYYPAVVRRGALQIAISTGGQSPALAQRLKREIEEQLPPEYEQWVEELGRKRERLFRRAIDSERRRHLLHRLASRERFERFLKSGVGSRDPVVGSSHQNVPRTPNPEPQIPVVPPRLPTPDSRESIWWRPGRAIRTC